MTKALGRYQRLAGNAGIVRLAAIYEELEHHEGWRDFIGIVERYRDQLQRDLELGKFSTTREPSVTDADLRAMLYFTSRILSIPSEVRMRYDMWRQRDEELRKVEARAEAAGGRRLV